MTWSFPGVTSPVELTYTQTRGVHPDAILMRILPQAGVIPTSGTVTITDAGSSITLPNVFVDKGTLTYSGNGMHFLLFAWDRREWWKRAAPISGYYNTSRAGGYVTGRKKNLRELIVLLLTALGESSATVTAVPTTVYPEVRWENERPHLMLEQLLTTNGLDVCLGFGSEAVTVVQTGSGSSLPTGYEFQQSLTADPKTRPRYVRTCFGPSRMQARFLLEAVVKEADGTWELLDDASFIPTVGWGREDPYSLPNVQAESGDTVWQLALQTAFRAYRVKAFADDSLTLPDSSGTLSSITQVLPLVGHLLTSESPQDDSFSPPRIFGIHFREVHEKGQPVTLETTAANFELSNYQYHFDTANGVIIFYKPLYQLINSGADFAPAELYLECSFGLRNATTFAPTTYVKDVDFDTSGTGYEIVKIPDQYAQVIVSYNTDHTVSGSANNQATLDAIATAQAAVIVGGSSSSFSEVKVYCIPVLSIRLDGAISQVQHVITAGDSRHAVNRTTASRFTEFDSNIPSRRQRTAYLESIIASSEARWRNASSRVEDFHER